MFVKTTASVLAVLLLSGAAFAQSASSGNAQLAALAGVQPGLYSNNQLTELIEARREGDDETVKFILSQSGADVTRSGNFASGPAVGPGWDMMARANGVQPGVYTADELTLMEAERLLN